MLSLPPSVKIYLATEPVDLRRGHDGLMAIVRNQWHRDVYGGHLFVFCSRRGNRLKVLWWDHGGFVLYYKRLERGRFRLPAVTADQQAVEIDGTELAMILDGIDTRCVRRPKHWSPPRPLPSSPWSEPPSAPRPQ